MRLALKKLNSLNKLLFFFLYFLSIPKIGLGVSYWTTIFDVKTFTNVFTSMQKLNIYFSYFFYTLISATYLFILYYQLIS